MENKTKPYKHTPQFARAKRYAMDYASAHGLEAHVVVARSGYYVGHYPDANPEALVYRVTPGKKRGVLLKAEHPEAPQHSE